MSEYILRKRFHGLAICGEVNLPYGTKCTEVNDFIMHDGNVICRRKSQTALDYFSINNDGNGLLRGKLVDNIMRELKSGSKYHDEKWESVQKDSIAQTLRREDHEDFWLWSYKFFEASIDDLTHIDNLIKEAKRNVQNHIV